MKLIIGLGNPGKQYQKTRHNSGRLIAYGLWFTLLNFQEKFGRARMANSFKLMKKFKALIAEGKIGKEKIILALPETFMNNSGWTVKALAKFYKIKPPDIWVIYDDIDLPFGKIRIRQSGSAGGHKGVASIIKELGTGEFVRFRIGIQPIIKTKTDVILSASEGSRDNNLKLEKFVLEKFSKEEQNVLEKKIIPKIIEAIEMALKDGVEKAMNKFN